MFSMGNVNIWESLNEYVVNLGAYKSVKRQLPFIITASRPAYFCILFVNLLEEIVVPTRVGIDTVWTFCVLPFFAFELEAARDFPDLDFAT